MPVFHSAPGFDMYYEVDGYTDPWTTLQSGHSRV